MTRRYFSPELPPAGGLVELPESEAQHATRVMRVQVGESITLFDGKGKEAESVVASVGRGSCQCQSDPAREVDRESSRPLSLGIALPKPDRARELIERLTELGVASVTPLMTARSQRPPSSSALKKLDRIVVEASKQCGRNRLMRIGPLIEAKTFFETASSDSGERWIAHPDGTPLKEKADRVQGLVTALIGPEGGWTDDELLTATANGFTKIGLGKRILRIETAAAAVASYLSD